MLKTAFSVIGVVLLLPGLIFFLQGINLLPGSFMTGDPQWVMNGAIMMAAGGGLIWLAMRGRRR